MNTTASDLKDFHLLGLNKGNFMIPKVMLGGSVIQQLVVGFNCPAALRC